MESYNPHLEAPAQEFSFAFDHHQDQEDEDALSLCDLPLHDEHSEEDTPVSDFPEEEDYFEFPVDPVYGYYPMDIVFCGKSIPCSKPINKQVKQLGSRSESFKFGHCPCASKSQSPQQNNKASRQLKSKSSNNNKHFMGMGLVKYQEREMDLNEIRKRQGKRAPVAMFQVSGGEKAEVVKSDEGKGEHAESGGGIRPLRCRSHLLSALAKVALGCIPRV